MRDSFGPDHASAAYDRLRT